jgi:hypothetical protein
MRRLEQMKASIRWTYSPVSNPHPSSLDGPDSGNIPEYAAKGRPPISSVGGLETTKEITNIKFNLEFGLKYLLNILIIFSIILLH